jgi:peroxiredoxin
LRSGAVFLALYPTDAGRLVCRISGRRVALASRRISYDHLPGFIVSEAAFKAKGVDAIAMTSVNDHHVLSAWSDATGAKGHVDFLADGAGAFAKALGLDFDASAGGLGVRSKRYAMLVVDGVIKELNIEPEPGKADVSSAAHLLEQMK